MSQIKLTLVQGVGDPQSVGYHQECLWGKYVVVRHPDGVIEMIAVDQSQGHAAMVDEFASEYSGQNSIDVPMVQEGKKPGILGGGKVAFHPDSLSEKGARLYDESHDYGPEPVGIRQELAGALQEYLGGAWYVEHPHSR